MNLIELQNKVAAYEAEIERLMSGEVTDEAAREAQVVSGKLAEAREMLMAEANRVQAENAELRASAESVAAAEHAATFAELVLGPRDAFQGVEPGWRATVDASYAPASLPTPEKRDLELPGAVALPMGVIDTLPKGLTDADERYFQMPDFTNNAAIWTSGDKAESMIEWPEAIAHLETIAHHMPIPKLAARRYRTLENTVSGALMLGLAVRKDAHVVAGNNSNGIVGLVNQPGILTHAQASGENLYDTVVTMAARCKVASGLAPNCVAMPTALVTSLKKAKGADGHYLYDEIVKNGTIDGLQIVPDENLAVTDGGTTTNGVLVYFSAAAQFNTADPDELTIGLVGNQFIQNAYTLLAEGTHALKLPFPKAVCYCSAVA